MALDNNQVVQSLVAFYKSRGVDLTALLTDPFFNGLPLEDKVNTIKERAGEINAHSSTTLSAFDKKQILMEAAMKGLGVGATGAALLYQALSHGSLVPGSAKKAMAFAVIPSLLAAGMVGGGLAAAKINNVKKDKLATMNDLRRVQQNPSTDNALAVLAAINLANARRPIRDRTVDSFGALVDSSLNKHLAGEEALKSKFNEFYKTYHPDHQ